MYFILSYEACFSIRAKRLDCSHLKYDHSVLWTGMRIFYRPPTPLSRPKFSSAVKSASAATFEPNRHLVASTLLYGVFFFLYTQTQIRTHTTTKAHATHTIHYRIAFTLDRTLTPSSRNSCEPMSVKHFRSHAQLPTNHHRQVHRKTKQRRSFKILPLTSIEKFLLFTSNQQPPF